MMKKNIEDLEYKNLTYKNINKDLNYKLKNILIKINNVSNETNKTNETDKEICENKR